MPVCSRSNLFMTEDICRGGINSPRVFLIGAHWGDYAECFECFMRRQFRSLVGLLSSGCGGEIDAIAYATVLSVTCSAFRRS
jgi:hypothetical protein